MYFTNELHAKFFLAPVSLDNNFFCSTLSEFQNFLLYERILINVTTKHQANFKGFKRFGAFKGFVEQKNVVFNSLVCKGVCKGPIYTQTRQINYYFDTLKI
jgi:hypothetical protein